MQEQRFYDGDNRLTCIQAQGPSVSGGATLLQSYAYGYSPLGVTTAISSYAATTCGGAQPTAQTLAGDAFGRLTASGGITWTYDANDNLTSLARDPRVGGTAPLSQTYAYANADGSLPTGALPNELLAVRNGSQSGVTLAAAYGYDRSGDTVAITTLNATAGTTTTRVLGYDATGRLTGITSTDGLSVTVGYNARGLRASLAVSDAHPDKGNAANFVERMTYRGDRLGQVAVVEGSASFTETFLYRQDGEPLELLYQAQGQAVPTRYYYALDGRGDVTALTDAQGQVVDQLRPVGSGHGGERRRGGAGAGGGRGAAAAALPGLRVRRVVRRGGAVVQRRVREQGRPAAAVVLAGSALVRPDAGAVPAAGPLGPGRGALVCLLSRRPGRLRRSNRARQPEHRARATD